MNKQLMMRECVRILLESHNCLFIYLSAPPFICVNDWGLTIPLGSNSPCPQGGS